MIFMNKSLVMPALDLKTSKIMAFQQNTENLGCKCCKSTVWNATVHAAIYCITIPWYYKILNVAGIWYYCLIFRY